MLWLERAQKVVQYFHRLLTERLLSLVRQLFLVTINGFFSVSLDFSVA